MAYLQKPRSLLNYNGGLIEMFEAIDSIICCCAESGLKLMPKVVPIRLIEAVLAPCEVIQEVSKIPDSIPYIPNFTPRIPDSTSLIADSTPWILDSISWIPDSKANKRSDSGLPHMERLFVTSCHEFVVIILLPTC
jgi:hypothetical protein